MRQLPELEFEITRSAVGGLICLIRKDNLMTIRAAALDFHLNSLRTFLDLGAAALVALARDNLALSTALGTRLLHLLHEPWRDLLPHNAHTRTTAPVASRNVAGTVCTRATTAPAQKLLDVQHLCACVRE